MDAISYIFLGKLPVNLLSPVTMHNISRNVLFHLPECYEFLAGTRAENAHLYYDLVKVAVIGDGVIGIFHLHNPSGRTMALGSTQTLT